MRVLREVMSIRAECNNYVSYYDAVLGRCTILDAVQYLRRRRFAADGGPTLIASTLDLH